LSHIEPEHATAVEGIERYEEKGHGKILFGEGLSEPDLKVVE